jgi:hypothetical protein
MTDKPTWEQIQRERDERVALPLDEDEALSGLMQVDPKSESQGEPAEDGRPDHS